MAGPMTRSDPDAALVARILRERHEVQSQQIPPGAGKTPDLHCVGRDGTQFSCEVKTLVDDPDWPPADGQLHSKRDTGPERVGRAIGEARAQLATRPRPWVLAVVNRDPMLDQMDMHAAFEGRLGYMNTDGTLHHYDISARRVAVGYIRERKFDIDLYIWFECARGRRDDPEVFFRVHHRNGAAFAEAAFGLPHIPTPDERSTAPASD